MPYTGFRPKTLSELVHVSNSFSTFPGPPGSLLQSVFALPKASGMCHKCKESQRKTQLPQILLPCLVLPPLLPWLSPGHVCASVVGLHTGPSSTQSPKGSQLQIRVFSSPAMAAPQCVGSGDDLPPSSGVSNSFSLGATSAPWCLQKAQCNFRTV